MKTYSDHKKLTERAFSQSLVVSIISVILCMVALSTVTWAWFQDTVSAGSTVIKTADCTVEVSVTDADGAVTPVGDVYTFEKDKVYTVDIKVSGSAQYGYCIFVVDQESYYTPQIPTTGGNAMKFSMVFKEQTKVSIIKCWGVSSQLLRHFANNGYYVDLEAATPPGVTDTTQSSSTTDAATTETGTADSTQETSAPEAGK